MEIEIPIDKKKQFYEILADEGSLNQIYGRIGQGKTYIATAMIFDDLARGQVVYANWQVNFTGLDELDNKFSLFLGVLGLKRYFLCVPAYNFSYLDTSDPDIHRKIGSLTDCIIYLDEGHLVYDSYITTRMDIRDRANILHTRHFDRTINIISQRPTAIHATLRENVNRFFKCVRQFKIGPFVRFNLFEYQDLDANGKPSEDDECLISKKSYWGRKKIFNAYNTKYLRGNAPKSQLNDAKGVYISWSDRFDRLFSRKKYKLVKVDFMETWKDKNENN